MPKRHAPRGRLRAQPNPKDAPDHKDAPSFEPCTATAKGSGKRCKRRPIPGGTVCVKHGGGAPQVKLKAEERLKALIDPAIARLHELVVQKEFPSVAIAAVKDVLDRNGALGKAAEKPLQVNLNIADERVRRLAAARAKSDKK